MALGNLVRAGYHFGSCEQRVASHVQRRRPRVRVATGDVDGEPFICLRALHDADSSARVLQNGALFNVQLKMRADRVGVVRARDGANDSEALKFRLDRLAAVEDVVRVPSRLERNLASPDARRHHGHGEPRALLAVVSSVARAMFYLDLVARTLSS